MGMENKIGRLIMDYEKFHNETLRNLQEMVSKGKITEAVAKGICADFVAKSEDEKVSKGKITEAVAKGICADFVAKSEDEKVRKALLEIVHDTTGDSLWVDYNVHKEDAISWLEKQGKQEKLNAYIDKLASDTIYNDENGNPIDKDLMAFASKVAFSIIPATKTESYHDLNRSRISEAVIKGAQWKKQGEQKPAIEMKTPEESLGIDSKTYNNIVDECIYGEHKPTDKVESKFKVGQTIKKEGFNLGFTIVKIDDDFYYNNMGDYFPFTDQDNWELVEQKSAETVKWSPQEESCICQLESLVKEQWRQADKVHNSVNIKKMSELMFFLKTLNPNKKPQRIVSAKAKEAMYDKPAWSEEDEEKMNWIIATLNNCSMRNSESLPMNESCEDWLKSLKDRYTWKPSDEQMSALKKATYDLCGKDEHNVITGLYYELEHLKAL